VEFDTLRGAIEMGNNLNGRSLLIGRMPDSTDDTSDICITVLSKIAIALDLAPKFCNAHRIVIRTQKKFRIHTKKKSCPRQEISPSKSFAQLHQYFSSIEFRKHNEYTRCHR
jgi:hypothetical protein